MHRGPLCDKDARLRRELGFPGMVVMQFGFDPDDPHGPHRLENHEADSVAYTGTHDTDTPSRLMRAARPTRVARTLSRSTTDAARSTAAWGATSTTSPARKAKYRIRNCEEVDYRPESQRGALKPLS